MKKRKLKRSTKVFQQRKGERKGERSFFFFEKSVWQQKKESNNEEGGQREREHQEGTHKGVENMKKSQQIEKETRNMSIRMVTIKMEM